jgi:hypothetical protein
MQFSCRIKSVLTIWPRVPENVNSVMSAGSQHSLADGTGSVRCKSVHLFVVSFQLGQSVITLDEICCEQEFRVT